MLKILLFLFLSPTLHATYYTYDLEEINAPTDREITWEEIVYWDNQEKEALKFVTEESLPIRLETYLRSAENDFAELSQQISGGKPKGSIAPLAKSLIELIVPQYRVDPKTKGLDDPYSQTLGKIVFEKYKERFLEEGKLTPYDLHLTDTSWKGKIPYYGTTLGNLKPWIIEDVKEFRAAKPPELIEFWNLQADEVLRERSEVEPKEIALIEFWGSPNHTLADTADDYMLKKNIPLEKRLEIRGELARLTSDTIGAMYDSKYTYLIPRPQMINKKIVTVIPCPNHPSYPSGHSTVSAMSAAYLSHRFPENEEKWWRIANDCGMSRVLGGLHYQIDHVGGQDLGVRIANKAFTRG